VPAGSKSVSRRSYVTRSSGLSRSRRAHLRAAHPWPARVPQWFWRWAVWRRHGAIPSVRPAGAPARIPRWAWRRFRAL
jgi:hypothetical protein